MRIKIVGKKEAEAYVSASKLIAELGHDITELWECDIAVAPLLTQIVPSETLSVPRLGTLIFHPSPLPHGRGAAAIKWAYKRRDPISAATWFWANVGKVDSGDICETEIVRINYNLRPRDFYERDIIPAMVRTLKRALNDIERGVIRRVPQVERYASFDYKNKSPV